MAMSSKRLKVSYFIRMIDPSVTVGFCKLTNHVLLNIPLCFAVEFTSLKPLFWERICKDKGFQMISLKTNIVIEFMTYREGRSSYDIRSGELASQALEVCDKIV